MLALTLFMSLNGDASKDAERRLLLGSAVHREKVRMASGDTHFTLRHMRAHGTGPGHSYFLSVSSIAFLAASAAFAMPPNKPFAIFFVMSPN